mmetsp:Transcript_73998/g.176117  ORF Transcript_73998/g.176117 Transcript_73998/m.176117 type:complete len:413 (+) Transcript_73998:97-1335(+)
MALSPTAGGMRLNVSASDGHLGRASTLPVGSPRASSKRPASFADANFFEDRDSIRVSEEYTSRSHSKLPGASPSPRMGSKRPTHPQVDAMALMNVDAGPSAEALAAARAHLAGVLQQVEWLHKRIEQEKDSVIGAADRDRQTIEGLRREIRHLQVDLQHAHKKTDQLSAEKQELLQVQARLEGELRTTRDALETSKQRLRHRSTDVQQLARQLINADMTPVVPVSPRLESLPDLPEEEPSSQQQASRTGQTGPQSSTGDPDPSWTTAQDGLPMQSSWLTASSDEVALRNPMLQAVTELSIAKAQKPTSKAQALAAVKAAQMELLRERRKREKLERNLQKDHAHLLQLVAVTRQQREEIRLLEGYAEEATRGNAAMDSGAADLAAASPSDTPSAKGEGGVERRRSAPTRLPPV